MVEPARPVSLADRLAGWRNRLVASPRFQRFAASFPLTKPIAQRQSQALFDLCAGFVYAQVLQACVQLDLFRILEAGPRSVAELAPRLAMTESATERLLGAAAALDLVERRSGGRYGLAMLGAALLGNPGVGAMIAHHRLLYDDLADPLALLRGESRPTALSGYWGYATADQPAAAPPAEVAAYSALMAQSQHLVADDILAAYDFAQHRRILDVGGGEGAFLIRVAAQAKAPALTLFDLPAVAVRAQVRFEAEGLGPRAATFGGDMHRDALPGGADLVTLVRVLHDHDDAAVRALLARIRACLPPGGTLLIAEPMAGSADTRRMAEAYFAFYLLAMGSGRARSPEELTAFLREAGFTEIRTLRTRRPLLTGGMTARVG
ncbi:MAG: methyltransferase [Bosea sp. (in: a-proteobacteria)]|uniref:methyltransferase n=1 Tax=Bosea sp. (in: a-proteobacteria) TaxID=1871050 RepID=UPI002733C8F1|nr:methyltransferase [Bosea sp. (in: a-proteobacteria)]MDP3600397.1 methyltransferase [Bosea sp. (in: a-proteobacteria)]